MSEISSTADQMLSVLEEVARSGPVSVSDLGVRCGLNRTVTHRLVATLHRRGYVRRNSGKYALGPAINRLAGAPLVELGTIAAPLIKALAESVGETVVLHVRDGLEALVLHQVVPDRHIVRVQHLPGSKSTLALGASGRVILAFQPRALVLRVAGEAGGLEALETRLQTIRSTGHDISHDELQQGVHGLAAPLRDPAGDVSASLAILVPNSRAPSLGSYLGSLQATISDVESGLRGG